MEGSPSPVLLCPSGLLATNGLQTDSSILRLALLPEAAEYDTVSSLHVSYVASSPCSSVCFFLHQLHNCSLSGGSCAC